MRLGLNYVPAHSTPEEWAEKLRKKGVRAASFPVRYTAPTGLIDAYVKEAKARDILIAEVGIWNSPNHPDRQTAQEALAVCEEQLRLAEYVGARCCVNVSGAAGPVWHGCYRENYLEDTYRRNIEIVRYLCDRVKPVRTYYTLEVMQWMLPDSPEQYRKFLNDVERERFAVHMDAVNFINSPYRYTHQEEVMDEAFRLLGGKIRSCHLKDCILEPGITVSMKEVPGGEGRFQIPYLLKKAAELDPDTPVLLEHLSSEEEYDRVFAYVKTLAGAVTA